MPINEWWAGDPDERYWLEITDREDLGGDLHAPKHDQSGRETWSYELVRFVQDGDVVLHWWKQHGQDPALVGYSHAVGSLATSTITWQAHGSYGRASGRSLTSPSWRFPLAEYTELDVPITLGRLRELESSLRAVRDTLADEINGALYYPFALSDKRPIRTTQAYLVKMPVSTLYAVPELAFLALGDRAFMGDLSLPRSSGRRERLPGGGGRQLDAEDRKAIERHAVDWSMAYLAGRGFEVTDVGHLVLFDILAMSDDEEVRVEVKGSTGTAATVELTDGEVLESRGEWTSALIVVDEIRLARRPDGGRTTSGGRPRIWWSWVADNPRLSPTRYRYVLPSGGFDSHAPE